MAAGGKTKDSEAVRIDAVLRGMRTRPTNGSLRVPGRTPIDEVSDVLGMELPDTEWDTVAGLVFNLLGHVPEEGESVAFQGLELRTEQV